MKKSIITVLTTVVVLLAVFFIYILSGAYDVSQLAPHNSITKSIINMTTHFSINKRLKEVVVPDNLKDTSLLILGFQHYNEMCSSCHAGPGVNASEMAKGLYPLPPELYKFTEAGDAQEFFWITKYGIKMTSMPAFKPTHNDEQIWAITAFVTQKLPKMSSDEYSAWVNKYSHENIEEEIPDGSK